MKKILALALMFLIFATPILAQAANTASQKSGNTPATEKSPERGKGLTNAIEHVPSFVAEKLTYQAKLFSESTRGIGRSLSEWIHSFFSPVIKNETNSD